MNVVATWNSLKLVMKNRQSFGNRIDDYFWFQTSVNVSINVKTPEEDGQCFGNEFAHQEG